MESCGGSHWLARKCQSFGHEVKLIPPQYVKPYVKTNKNDYIDADAIAEASTRPSMRFVGVKTETAQVISVIQRIRSSYVKERTACMSRIGAILLEFGMSFPKGHSKMKQLVEQNEDAQLLKSIPGVGNLTASQCLADISDVGHFKNGRQLAAWIGLVPHQYSTGGKTTLLGISKRGNKALRTLFIHGARSILSRPEVAVAVFGEWILELRARKPFNVAVVALANKLVRIAWSVLSTKQAFEVRV
jgi:transposase